jgi:PleD family two-component response regulator
MTEAEASNRPRLVLIVNDQEWAARSMETILGPQGYAVLRAYNARQAFELARRTQPDVVIVDARLPDADGIELCAQLRESGLLSAATPTLITTSDPASRGQQVAAYKAGAWDFLLLPLDAEVLLLKLASFMRAKQETDRLNEEGLLDQATGLYNARGLARRAREIGAEAHRRRAPLACVAFAPDAAGSGLDERAMDELAVEIAEHLGTLIGRVGRTSDAIGRLGQSEFAIIAPATEAKGAQRLAERIRGVIEQVPLKVGPRHGSASSMPEQQSAPRTEQVRVRAGYYAVPDFAESSVDAVEMLVRAASALRQPSSNGNSVSAIRAFEAQPASLVS